MEKKSKKSILIGITALILVIVLLLGFTYAYYRTRIIGNESTEPSISVQSEKAEITYEDGTSEMNMTGLIKPGFQATKTFYVENTGDQSVNYSIVLENMNNTFERNQDWKYVLTENGSKIAEGNLAVGTHQILSGSRTISETNGTKNTYILTLNYINSDENQSTDMGGTISFKVNIKEEQYTWNDAPEGSLLYSLKQYRPTSLDETIPGRENSLENEKRIVETEDDYGTSYAYRGNVDNNYVTYSNMCWRIVRVQGDGTIKLILADSEEPCNIDSDTLNKNGAISNNHYWQIHYNYANYSLDGAYFKNSAIPAELNRWLTEKKLDSSQLEKTDWCNDTSIENYYTTENENENTSLTHNYIYSSKSRLENYETATPSLKCNFKGIEINGEQTKATKYNESIGILSADEVVFAGYSTKYESKIFDKYLSIYPDMGSFAFTMTPLSLDYYTFNSNENYDGINYPYGYFNGHLGFIFNNNQLLQNLNSIDVAIGSVRPAIVLKSTVLLAETDYTQDGTINNPYVIK